MSDSAPIRALIVDDEPALLYALEDLLKGKGCEVAAFESPRKAIAHLAQSPIDVVLADMKMPELSGLELLQTVKARRPEVEVIIMTGYAAVDSAVAAVKAGAYDYLTKPFEDIERVWQVVSKAAERKSLYDRNRQLEAQLRESGGGAAAFVASAPEMRDVLHMVDTVAFSSATVLVTGESGTGKELVARAIHEKSPRKREAFVAINCGALAETLLESELFGYVKGAFTGAQRDHDGLFKAANRGTLFLDEVGDLPPAMQVKLLRALQEGEVKPVGAVDSVKVDVRVVAATHRDLTKLVKQGKFREDLYYRLNVINICLPALRERQGDIPVLAHHFLRRFADRFSKPVTTITVDAMALLVAHRWQGNVRELENAMERAVVMCRGDAVQAGDLPPDIAGRSAPVLLDAVKIGDDAELLKLPYTAAKEQALLRFEKAYLEGLMRECQGNISAAARKASMDRTNFKRLLKKYLIADDDEGQRETG